MSEGGATPGVVVDVPSADGDAPGAGTAPAGREDGNVADGRVRRRMRSQAAIVDAVLDLLTEGNDRFTAQDVADRSGVSVRSIFRQFDDMASLQRQAVARQAERVAGLLVRLPKEGPVADRIAALVRSRREVFEAISPVRRFAVRLAHRSPPVRDELARGSGFYRAQMAKVFAAEVAAGDDGGALLEALDLVTCWESWERLRTIQGLDPDAAAAAMTRALTALLPAGPETGAEAADGDAADGDGFGDGGPERPA